MVYQSGAEDVLLFNPGDEHISSQPHKDQFHPACELVKVIFYILYQQDEEGFTVEYKECVNGLNNSVFETVCSFSNRYGGYILPGVKEVEHKGVVIGVNPN